jgi:hypothetical protein
MREEIWSSRAEIKSLFGLVVRLYGYRSRSPGFNSQRYQIFWQVIGLERDPLNRVRIIEMLLEWTNCGSDLENWLYGRWDPLRWARDNLYPQKLALTSPTSGDRSDGIVRLRNNPWRLFACLFVCLFVCWRESERLNTFHTVREGLNDPTESWNIVTHVIQVTYSLQKACLQTKRQRDIERRLNLIRRDEVSNGVSWCP